jgi:hypothetical protein
MFLHEALFPSALSLCVNHPIISPGDKCRYFSNYSSNHSKSYGASTSAIFWEIMSCRLLKVNCCFGGTYRPHIQSERT